MRIVDITMFWTPDSGGVRTYLQAKREWIGRRSDLEHRLLVPGQENACDQGICAQKAPHLPFGHGYRFPLATRPWVNRLKHLRPDLIEAGDPYVTAWAAIQAGREMNVPVVGFYHSDLQRLVSSRFGHWTDAWLDRYIANLYRHFDQVLAPSQVMANKLRSLGVTRVHVQPLGVDTEHFHPRLRDPAVRHELGLNADTHLLVFAGRGSREKHIPVLLEAMTLLGAGYHLHLAGSHMPAHLPNNVSRSNGFLDRQHLARLLASSDALVHAGDQETFGLIVLEAMASGIPVIGMNTGAVSELVVPATGRLARAGSASSLADQVRVVLANDPHGMGSRARAHVLAHYDWNAVLPRLLDHYLALTRPQIKWPDAAHG